MGRNGHHPASLDLDHRIALAPRSVADFHAMVMAELHGLGLDVVIRTTPCEIAEAIPFLRQMQSRHFFWGSFDLAVTRFSGRTAPVHPGGIPNLPDWVTREAYSHEVISAGFWPGGGGVNAPSFYCYAYLSPQGFSDSSITPAGASWNASLGEFLLPYASVQAASSPDDVLLSFLQSTYEAAAQGLSWEREQLERQPIRVAVDSAPSTA